MRSTSLATKTEKSGRSGRAAELDVWRKPLRRFMQGLRANLPPNFVWMHVLLFRLSATDWVG